MSAARIDYRELVRDDRIHGRLYYDEEIFREEMERIFSRVWVYVGHESEVAEPGEFVTRWIGSQPVILVRDNRRSLNLLLNRCRHRGNTICQIEKGNAGGGFRCAYHGWTYANNGDLVGVTYGAGADPRDFRKEDYGLNRVALESYKGFLFGNLNPNGTSLESQLGRSIRLIDQILDQSPTGEVTVRGGALKHMYRANWKMAVENVVDSYHPLFLHSSTFKMIDSAGKFDWDSIYGPGGNARVRDLGNGHAQIDFSAQNRKAGSFLHSPISATARKDYVEGLAARIGRERASDILADGDPHFEIFPNFNYLPPGEIRIIRPVGVAETHIYYFPVLFKGAPDEINLERHQQVCLLHGSAGVIAPDDIDVYERNQEGFRARADEWLILNRGIRSEVREEDGAIVGMAYEETTQRGIWREYRDLMTRA